MERYTVFELDKIMEQITSFCATSLGKDELAKEEVIFEYLKINRDLQRSKEMLEIVVHYGDLSFSGIRNITQALKKADMDSILTPYELVSIADHNEGTRRLIKFFSELEKSYPKLQDIIDSLEVHDKIEKAIRPVFNSSNEINDNASLTLRNIRTNIKKTESAIASHLERFINGHNSILMENIVAYRNDRSVVYVKVAEKNSIKGIVHGESMSGQTAYVEPECVIGLNNDLQSLRSKEEVEIERILFELSQLVKEVSASFLSNCSTLGILDAISAKAIWGKKQNACIPDFRKTNDIFYLHQARHPLINPAKVVSNTIDLRDGKRVLLITGSNTGGKTVTLKTIGLFTLLTYLAIPLPCEEAIVGFYDDIFVDLGDSQSIMESLSTFSAHLSKLATICDYATCNSLVLIDEFGSGTDPKEGEALAIAILNYLRNIKSMVVVTTHYGRLKFYGLKHPDIEMSQVEFDMEKLSPTFRFIQGSTGQSNAIDIAMRFGIKKGIVKDALNIKLSAMSEEEKLNAKLEALTNENEALKFKLTSELEEARLKQAALDLKLSEFERDKDKIRLKAENDINNYIEEAKMEADLILEELKEQKVERKPHELVELKGKLNKLVIESADNNKKIIDQVIHVGDFVEIISLGKVGQVNALDKKNEATIMLHGTKIKMKINNLRKTVSPLGNKKVPSSSYSFKKPASVSMECNIIGKRVEEALVEVDKYLDSAMLSNLNSVRIIHGHGTGALRSAVHEKLKQNKNIESYRLGQGNEGGVGATIVIFKTR